MGYYTTAEIVKIVNKLIDRCGTRDPYKVAKELGINIIYRNFDKQRGAYKVILKNRFVFLKNGMHPVVEQIVLWHEIGHDVLHRQEAVAVGGFKEFNIVWSMKQISSLLRLRSRTTPFWNTLKTAMTFSRLHGQCVLT